VLPAVLVVLLPGILRTAIDRSFTAWQLTLAAPDVVLLLVVVALTGPAVSAARGVALIRARAAGTRRPTTPTRPGSGGQ
jgi:hypothetical protein